MTLHPSVLTDSLHDDLHKDFKADYNLANPLFNMSEWAANGSPTIPAGSTASPFVNKR